jgi:hypothetical protein
MDESMEKLLKELLQKKLHGTLSADEELILSDLVEQKRGGSSTSSSGLRSPDFTGLDRLMSETDSLSNSLDEMANKIRNRSGTAQSKHTIAEDDRKSKDKK